MSVGSCTMSVFEIGNQENPATRIEERGVSTVFVSSHPIVQHKIAGLRDVRTGAAEFRRLVRALSLLLAQEATADLPTTVSEVRTPLGPAATRTLSDVVGIVPILRAGLGMADGILELIPEAEVWHIGLFRDEASLRPTEYYNKFPARPRVTVALLIDPMLATGGSAVRACEIIKASRSAQVEADLAHRRPGGNRPHEPGDARRVDLRRCRRRAIKRSRVHLSRTRRCRRPAIRHTPGCEL